MASSDDVSIEEQAQDDQHKGDSEDDAKGYQPQGEVVVPLDPIPVAFHADRMRRSRVMAAASALALEFGHEIFGTRPNVVVTLGGHEANRFIIVVAVVLAILQFLVILFEPVA